MEEIVSRLEKVADKLTGNQTYVYVLEEHEYYDRWSNIIGCYDSAEKVHEAADNLIDWLSISLTDVKNLKENGVAESDNCGNRGVRIYKFILK